VIAMLVIMFAPDWVVALLRLHSGKQP
jgi:hypothetical protein